MDKLEKIKKLCKEKPEDLSSINIDKDIYVERKITGLNTSPMKATLEELNEYNAEKEKTCTTCKHNNKGGMICDDCSEMHKINNWEPKQQDVFGEGTEQIMLTGLTFILRFDNDGSLRIWSDERTKLELSQLLAEFNRRKRE